MYVDICLLLITSCVALFRGWVWLGIPTFGDGHGSPVVASSGTSSQPQVLHPKLLATRHGLVGHGRNPLLLPALNQQSWEWLDLS